MAIAVFLLLEQNVQRRAILLKLGCIFGPRSGWRGASVARLGLWARLFLRRRGVIRMSHAVKSADVRRQLGRLPFLIWILVIRLLRVLVQVHARHQLLLLEHCPIRCDSISASTRFLLLQCPLAMLIRSRRLLPRYLRHILTRPFNIGTVPVGHQAADLHRSTAAIKHAIIIQIRDSLLIEHRLHYYIVWYRIGRQLRLRPHLTHKQLARLEAEL